MIALLAACAQGSGCAAGTGAKQERRRSTESGDARDQREAGQGKGKPTVTMQKPPPPVEQSQTSAVVVDKPIPAKPVREGAPPIVYLLPASGALRVVDTTAGIEIAAAAAESRSILRVDNMTGVSIGKRTLLKGPLPPDREYAIYLSTGSENEVRNSVTSPRPSK